MKKCPNCGTYVDDSQKFCSYCGAPLDLDPEAAQNAAGTDGFLSDTPQDPFGQPAPGANAGAAWQTQNDPQTVYGPPNDGQQSAWQGDNSQNTWQGDNSQGAYRQNTWQQDPYQQGAAYQQNQYQQDPYQQNPYQQNQYQQNPYQQNQYQQDPYQQDPYRQNPYQQVPPTPGYQPPNGGSKGLAVAALVCGIGSIPLGLFTSFPGTILGIIALILGIVALKKKQPQGFGIAGIITGIAGAVIGIIMLIIALMVLRSAFGAVGGLQNYYESILENSDPAQFPQEFSDIVESLQEELGITDSGSDASSDASAEPEKSSEPDQAGTAAVTDSIVMFDQDGIKVTSGALEYDTWGDPNLNITIQNNTSDKVTVTGSAICVNGYVVEGWLYEQINPGNVVNSSISFMQEERDNIGIRKIGTIDVLLMVYDADTYDDVTGGNCATVKTDLYDEMDVPDNSDGVEIVNRDGIRIILKPTVITDDYGNAGVGVYIENNSDAAAYIYEQSTSLNGAAIEAYGSWTIPAGMKCSDWVIVYEEDLEASGIQDPTAITNGTISFRCVDNGTYDTIFETDDISFSLN